MDSSSNLSDKQLFFCHEYLVDLNATQAAIRAGYSEQTARQMGSENLAKPVIKAKIQELMDFREQRTQITADRVLVELSKIGFADVRKIFGAKGALLDASDIDDETAAAIQSIEVVTRLDSEEDEDGNKIPERTHKIKLSDKKGALELMGKHLKLWTEKTEITGADGKDLVPILNVNASRDRS